MPYTGDAAEIRSRASLSRVDPSKLRIAVTVPMLAVWIVVMVGLRAAAALLRVRAGEALPMIFHRGVRRIFNLHPVYHGRLRTECPTLYVANHVSYLDVFVLGAVLPGSFIAKSEVAGWPLFGQLARLQNTLFFERNTRRAAEQTEVMRNLFAAGRNLIFFPEGTSTPGTHVEPFRSSLFQAADGERQVHVQPVTIVYRDYDGEPMTQAERDYYAWYLPMTFLDHFVNALGLRPATVHLVFHEPVTVAACGTRKACAAHCERAVRHGLDAVLRGDDPLATR